MESKHFALVKERVLALFEDMYGDEAGVVTLAIDPTDFDLDPGPFYERLSETFDVPFDDERAPFGGFGGSLGHTIEHIAARWDGKTLVQGARWADDEGGMDD